MRFGVTVTVHRRRPRPVVRVAGALDAYGAPLVAALLDHVRSTDGQALLAGVREVTFADTHGLAPLLEPGVHIEEASPAVTRVLRLLDLAALRGGVGPRLPGHG